jgi:hypothetical protein
MIPEDAVSRAEVEAVLLKIRRARNDLSRIEREAGGSRDVCSVIAKLDEAIRRLTAQ